MPEDQVQDPDDTTDDTALATDDTTHDDTAVADDTELPGLNKKQMEQVGTLSGRYAAQQIEEKIMPLLQELKGSAGTSQQAPSQDAIENFKQQMSEEIYTDPYSAFSKMMDVRERAKVNLSKSQTVATDTAITAYSDDPCYKDIFTDARKIAHQATTEGFPPEAAAKLGIYQAKAAFLEPKKEPTDLGMIGGGVQTKITKEPKLPKEFEKDAKASIAKGYHKDMKDYISDISPAIRAKYNI